MHQLSLGFALSSHSANLAFPPAISSGIGLLSMSDEWRADRGHRSTQQITFAGEEAELQVFEEIPPVMITSSVRQQKPI